MKICCKNSCEATAYQLKLRNFRQALLDAAAELRLAAEDVEYWGGYAGEAFSDKWREDVIRIDDMADKLSSIAISGKE